MTMLLIGLLALHVLSSTFWAGSTFTLARNGGAGSETLFRPQMGAAAFALLTGASLWVMMHGSGISISEVVLLAGIVAAFVAAGVQGALRNKPAIAHRIAAFLLMLTVVCMVAARWV